MKIGLSFWGFLAPFEKNTFVNTPDGTRGDRVDFVDELLTRGHSIVRLQEQRDVEPYVGVSQDSSGFPDVDLVFCEWRWPTWKNSGASPSEPDYNRQRELLDYYHSRGTPILIHDGDLKMTPEDELRWPNAILADPCVEPKFLTRKRLSIPWCNYMKRHFDPCEYSYNYVYVGNNYERDNQFAEFYAAPSALLRAEGLQTMVHGNWLQRSPERKDPKDVLRSNHSISFGARLSYRDIFDVLNASITTTHITKDEYMPCGNITVRFYEAIKSNLPALIPWSYKHARPIGNLKHNSLIVEDKNDVVAKVKWLSKLSAQERRELVNEQESALRTVVDPRPSTRVDLLERIAQVGRP